MIVVMFVRLLVTMCMFVIVRMFVFVRMFVIVYMFVIVGMFVIVYKFVIVGMFVTKCMFMFVLVAVRILVIVPMRMHVLMLALTLCRLLRLEFRLAVVHARQTVNIEFLRGYRAANNIAYAHVETFRRQIDLAQLFHETLDRQTSRDHRAQKHVTGSAECAIEICDFHMFLSATLSRSQATPCRT
jgi:hypothetical protein